MNRIFVSNPKFSLKPFEEVLEEVEKEFEGWEIIAEKYHGWKYKEEIRDALSTSDLEVQVHAPLNDINIASINRRIREVSIEEIKRSMEMASMIDAEVVTVHPGVYSPLSQYLDSVLEISKGSLRELKKAAEEFSVKLAVENLPTMWITFCSEPEEIEELVREVGSAFCLDIGHAYIADRLDDFLDLDLPLANLHLHDNHGEDDVHLPLGQGDIELGKVLNSLKDYKGGLVIEGRDLEGLIESRDHLNAISGRDPA